MNSFLHFCLWIVPFFGALQAVLIFDNLRRFQKNSSSNSHYDSPSISFQSGDKPIISVLIPARNEEEKIGRCLASLKNQSLQNFEVVVLDDNSEDSTVDVIEREIKGDKRFSLLKGRVTPAGWTGKNYACYQLYQQSQGNWILFMDADTTLGPDALKHAITVAESENAALLSLWPRQETKSASEVLMIPVMTFILLAFLPLRFAESSPIPYFTAANGQFMLIRKNYYNQSGGHYELKDEIMDDVRLAQMIKKIGGRVIIRDAGENVKCRMYNSFKNIWLGFRKNLFPAFNGRVIVFFLSILVLAVGHCIPLVLTIFGFAFGLNFILYPMLLQLAICIFIRFFLAIKLNQSFLSPLFQPLAVFFTIAIAIDSFIGYNHGGVSWKGRVYKRN